MTRTNPKMKLGDPPRPITQAEVQHIEHAVGNWVGEADSLLVAAQAVWAVFEAAAHGPEEGRTTARMRQSRVALLLLGLAIENIVKGFLIQKAPGKAPRSHDLLALAGETGIQLAPQEAKTLSLLSEIVVWAGRYPTPAKIQNSLDHVFSPSELFSVGQHFVLRLRYYVTGGNPPERTF